MLYAFTVTRASTPERARLLNETITQARKTAGKEFKWLVVGSGVSDVGYDVINVAQNTGLVDDVHIYSDNVGQHVAWNYAFERAKQEKAKFFLRLDDDCEFLTKRWLRKLMDAMHDFNDEFVVSPTIRGLMNPPARSDVCRVKDIPVEFLSDAIGGICRLHPMSLIRSYVADVRLPMGAGDATSIARYCKERVIPMVYVKHVRLRHARTTEVQFTDDPEHFESHGIFQHVPYIPVWRRDAVSEHAHRERPGA